jgi:hypothetical protein
MTGREALNAARDAGIEVHVDGHDLVLQAKAAPPSAVIEIITRHKAQIVTLLLNSITEWLDQNPEPSDPGRCAWCRKGETPDAVVVPFGVLPSTHTWLHPRCWRAWHDARCARALAAIGAQGFTP